jgi:hypothetical protein
MKRIWRPSVRLRAIALGMIAIYVLTYVVLSRRGYAEADRYDLEGFYYVFPENTDAWRFGNRACEIVFLPLNQFDQWLSLGRCPAFEPLFSVSN